MVRRAQRASERSERRERSAADVCRCSRFHFQFQSFTGPRIVPGRPKKTHKTVHDVPKMFNEARRAQREGERSDCGEYFVATLMVSKRYEGVHSVIALPVTVWVVSESKLSLPKQAADFISDSAFREFRFENILRLRELFTGIRRWALTPGAWEGDTAAELLMSGKRDTKIAAANCNRLQKQGDLRTPVCLDICCQKLGGALRKLQVNLFSLLVI